MCSTSLSTLIIHIGIDASNMPGCHSLTAAGRLLLLLGALVDAEQIVCQTCTSELECLDVGLIANPAKAAFRISGCDGLTCTLNCALGHYGSATAACNVPAQRYELKGCEPTTKLRGPAKLAALVGKPNVTIYFLHNRKASGTTIHFWLAAVAKANGWSLLRLEGNSVSLEILEEMQQVGVVITTLRGPVSRIISSYKYEGRYKLRTLHYAWMNNKTLVTEADVDRTPEQYSEEAEREAQRPKMSPAGFGPNKLCLFKVWTCVSLCYVKMFSNNVCLHKQTSEQHDDLARDVTRSLDVLDKIDFVIIAEHLSNKRYRQRLESIFKAPPSTDPRLFAKQECETMDDASSQQQCIIPMTRKMPVTSNIPRPPYTPPESWVNSLREQNYVDILIYKHYLDKLYF
eukprot:m.90799 g.90799  ORF g.90799 m.90799 type:complete len:401 (-) comp26430_c0_seq2:148-1350(-)